MTLGLDGSRGRSTRQPRALVVDDHAMVREVLCLGLMAHGFECRSVGPEPPGDVLIEARRSRPDVVLLDLNLDRLDGLTLVEPLTATGARVLAVSGTHDEARVAAAIALGAVGFVSKGGSLAELAESARRAAAGQPLIPAEQQDELAEKGERHLSRKAAIHDRVEQLTGREREVLHLLGQGQSIPEVAAAMVVSVATVRSYVRNIHAKLGVSSQLAAVAIAAEAERTE